MYRTKIKICGITNLEDAQTAARLGADLLGFIFHAASPRYIEPKKAMEIIAKIPTFVDTVGVFVNPTAEQIRTVNEKGWLNWIQLHGDETPEFCGSLNWLSTRTMKAVRVREKTDITAALSYPVDALLFDTHVEGIYGGTGKTFDWSLLSHLNRRIFLSGGITPDNILQALAVGAWGVDINSGIESSPGKKDPRKMKHLFDIIGRSAGRKARL
ncbi:MAG TPA: phosphoribosylanthranilate isomerase [Anaerohalosphaeraceae bacterium]|nr:phosphoribosylanthranilate isomerase [Anaerohalosphaeraceae bacterium]